VFASNAVQFQPSPVAQTKHRDHGISMALPKVIGNVTTPFVDSAVRRSTRLSSASEGFHEVRMEQEPSKKRKGSVILINDKTGSSGPIPIDILQG
jgi:hypothetical protein